MGQTWGSHIWLTRAREGHKETSLEATTSQGTILPGTITFREMTTSPGRTTSPEMTSQGMKTSEGRIISWRYCLWLIVPWCVGEGGNVTLTKLGEYPEGECPWAKFPIGRKVNCADKRDYYQWRHNDPNRLTRTLKASSAAPAVAYENSRQNIDLWPGMSRAVSSPAPAASWGHECESVSIRRRRFHYCKAGSLRTIIPPAAR